MGTEGGCYSSTYDDEPTDLYESTSQTPWGHDHSAAVEEAERQRFLTETDGREFGSPDEELSATTLHLESGATIEFSGPSGRPFVGSEHDLLVWDVGDDE